MAAAKPSTGLSEGDTVGMTGEVTIVYEDGKVTFWLKGFDTPITLRGSPHGSGTSQILVFGN